MGRKKTKSFIPAERVQSYPSVNASVSARNLRQNDLGAVIFGTKHSTLDECLRTQLFGLPASHISYVRNIRPGLPLFLFNYSDRQMHGMFEAASPGELNINPYAWTGDGSEKTPYPAQVRILVRRHCKPLPEEQFSKIIIDNYHSDRHHFWFELDHAQTGALLSLFESSLKKDSSCGIPYIPPVQRNLRETITYKQEHSKFALKQATTDVAPCWLNLFKENPNADVRTGDGKLKASVEEVDCTLRSSSYVGEGSSTMISGWDKENDVTHVQETHSDTESMEGDVERVYLKLKQIARQRESSSTSREVRTEEAYVKCTMTDTHLKDECSPAAPSTPERWDDAYTDSSDLQSVIDQMRREIKDMKQSFMDQLKVTSFLETKLACSDAEIQRLKERVTLLESQLKNSSKAHVGEPLKHGNESE